MGKNNLVNKTQKDKYTTRKEVLTSFFLGSEYEFSTKKQIASFFEIPKSDLRQFDQILEELEKEGIVYLDDSKIVIYFDLYEIAPYAAGIPEFPIIVENIKPQIKEDYIELII